MWFLIVTLFPNATPLGILTGHLIALGLYFFLFLRTNFKIPGNLKYLLLMVLVFSVSIILSLVASTGRGGISMGIIRYAFVPFYWLFGLYAGITDVRLFKGQWKRFLFCMAAIFVTVQLPVVLLQMLGADSLLSGLWTAEKASSFTQYLRVVGTVHNPNTLGILCLLAICIFIQNLNQKRFWAYTFIFISIAIIVLTGSRTSLVLLFLLPFLHIHKKQFFSKKSLYIVLSGVFFLVSSYYLLLYYKNVFPYLSQILNLLSTGQVHTLQLRFTTWNSAGEIYKVSSDIKLLLGLGPNFFNAMDNSYLYILFNYGIMGLTTFIGLLISITMKINSQNNKIALRLLFVMLIAGTVTDLLISFLFMTIIFYLIGLKAELQHTRTPYFKESLAYS